MNKRFVDHPTRGAPLGALVVGIAFLALYHFFADRLPGALKLLVVLGSLFVTLGFGGLIDPRFFTGVMNEAKGVYPAWIRAVSMTLVAVGFAVGLFLLVVVYKAVP
jgi:hypothetical protein